MEPRTINVVFGQLAASTLRDALAARGEHEEIVVFPDDLSFGPVGVLSGPDRMRWIRDNFHLRADEWNIFPLQLEPFFHSINLLASKVICWVCKHAVDELCGFSALIDKSDAANLYAIETTTFRPGEFGDPAKTQGEPVPLKLAHVSPVIAAQLLGSEIALSPASRTELLAGWRHVRQENAALRVVDVDGLKSVPVSYFDKILLNRIEVKWQSALRVVTFAAADADQGEFFRVTMTALAQRLLGLADMGQIKMQGDINNFSGIQVCLI